MAAVGSFSTRDSWLAEMHLLIVVLVSLVFLAGCGKSPTAPGQAEPRPETITGEVYSSPAGFISMSSGIYPVPEGTFKVFV
jgi:hypothetical protein